MAAESLGAIAGAFFRELLKPDALANRPCCRMPCCRVPWAQPLLSWA
jgi:hypothetical protein